MLLEMFLSFPTMVPDLSSRPLTSAESDRGKYVRRPADDRIDRALGLGLNVLVSASRGMGATSLLFRLEGELSGRGTYLSLTDASAPADVIRMLLDRIEAPGAPTLDSLADVFGERDAALPGYVLAD